MQHTNMQVCNITTPANMFHALRRQTNRDFRKPLVIMTPKKLLRLPECVSPLRHLTMEGDHTMFFRKVIGDKAAMANPTDITRLIFCSGQH